MTDTDSNLVSFYEVARVISAVEGIVMIALVFVMVHKMGGWKTMDAGNRFRLSGVVLLAGAWSYGAIEAQLMGVDGALRSLFGAIALGYLCLAYGMCVRGMYSEEDV